MHLTVITIPSLSNSSKLRSETIMISVPTNGQMIISLCTFMVCCCCYCCAARDSITTGQNISDNGSDYLESPGKKFQMGFFSRGEASEVRRYVGIWYTMDPNTVVWVANRDTPVLDSTGFLTVSKDGSVKLLNGSQIQYFSTETGGDSLRALKLEDTGNAVLIDLASESKLWKSFETRTDTFLPGSNNIYSSSGNLKPENEKRVLAIVIFVTALVISTFCGISYISYKRMVNRSENNDHDVELQSNYTRRHITELLNLDHSKEEDREGIDVPYFELESIIAATDNFLEKNRLGQGGFGPVYKGKLPGGKEIAVKRLSSLSGQGLQEFKNEVMLIAKLQHRNLVRLVGYCIIGEEKMLIYEYMPNRSLDNFIFDRTLCTSLDWAMRFNIIMGIAKGLNYLHHDSRLRVIHRDLKTSNILLDEDMNPKISDFGLAKIVKGKDMEATTDRVIGTFGYMSPEYALDGLFSVKSDVFSFGVVMLEIVSGKRNIGFYQSRRSISLLGHAWNLWKEDKPLELMDQILMESCNSSEVLKCIIVGLLCVQGDPDDRPNMTNVILMLGGDIVTLPTPKEPASIPGRDYAASSSSSSSKTDTQSKNMLTITRLDGR